MVALAANFQLPEFKNVYMRMRVSSKATPSCMREIAGWSSGQCQEQNKLSVNRRNDCIGTKSFLKMHDH